MRIIIQTATGLRVEAILLAARRDGIRVAVNHRDDAAEFRFLEWEWVSERGERVEIESHGDGWPLMLLDGQVFRSAAHSMERRSGITAASWLN